MKRHFREILCAVALIFSPTAGHAADNATNADYRQFLLWWGGDYDNLAQAAAQEAAQEAAGRPTKDRNQATLLFMRKVDLPAFGTDVYYAEWQDAREPSKVTRQRVYAFEIDQAEKKLRLNLHIWPANRPEFVARTTGAYLDAHKLNGVTPADMAGLKGCDVFFDKTGDAFSGAMKKGACAFPAPNGTPIYSWSQMKLSATQFSYLDGWFNLDGTPFQRFTADWYVFDKKK